MKGKKELRCENCHKVYSSENVHNVLGIWVCKYCYPNVEKYCDCCSNRLYEKDVVEFCNNCHIVFSPDLEICEKCEKERFNYCLKKFKKIDKNKVDDFNNKLF